MKIVAADILHTMMDYEINEDLVNLFRELFPEGFLVTEDLCVKHHKDIFWRGLAYKFPPELKASFEQECEKLEKDYLKQCKIIETEYRKMVETSRLEKDPKKEKELYQKANEDYELMCCNNHDSLSLQVAVLFAKYVDQVQD